MHKGIISFLAILMAVTVSTSVLHISKGQKGANVVAYVEETELNRRPINVSSDKTEEFEEKYNGRDGSDVFVSEMGIVALEILIVIAFTIMYLDATKARRAIRGKLKQDHV